jgi:hypothetical protein
MLVWRSHLANTETSESKKGGAMIRTPIYGIATALLLSATPSGAQTKTLPVKTEIVTATVEAIDATNREVTVVKPDKTHDVMYFPSAVQRFDTLKVGDKITVKYYENIVLQVKAPGSKDVDTSTGGVMRAENAVAGTSSHQRTITATIAAIDPSVPSITFTGPRDWKYSTRVKDKEALSKVKVGDKVDITWTEAMVLSVDDVK